MNTTTITQPDMPAPIPKKVLRAFQTLTDASMGKLPPSPYRPKKDKNKRERRNKMLARRHKR